MKRALIVAVVALVSAAAASNVAIAGDTETFGASPTGSRGTFAYKSGEELRDTLELRNHTAKPLTLTLYAANATLGADGVVRIGFRHEPVTGLAARVRVPSHVTVPARSARTVNVAIPAERVAGSAAIVVEGPSTRGSSSLDVVERIAIMIRPDTGGAGSSTGGAAAPGSRAERGGPLRVFTGWSPPIVMLVGFLLFFLLRRRRRDEDERDRKPSTKPAPTAGSWSANADERRTHAVPVTSSARPVPVVRDRRAS